MDGLSSQDITSNGSGFYFGPSGFGIPLREEADILYRFACRYGADPVTGLIYDQIDAGGVPLVKDSRSWPQTEALKAHLAMVEVHGLDTRLQIGRTQSTTSSSTISNGSHMARGWITAGTMGGRPWTKSRPRLSIICNLPSRSS